MIVDKKLSESRDKEISLNNHVQEANNAMCNNTIAYLCFELEKLERKLQMILDHQMRVVRVNNNSLNKTVHEYKNKSTFQSKQLRNNVMDSLGLSNPKRVRTCQVDGKGEIVSGVHLFDGDTMIVTQKFQSDCGLVSADPPSISTVCNGFAGDIKYSSSYKLDEVSRLLDYMYYPLYSAWKFPEFPFLFHQPTVASCWAITRFK